MATALLMRQRHSAALFLTCVLLPLGRSTVAQAQIVPDNTLGNETSIVTEDAAVRGLPADLIEGGAVRGSNIFHSFSDFNIADLQRVYFANPTGIENILSRVTGENPSNLLGTLGVDGGANLFLLNPNGIVFGPNAQLDITGSFFASTAEAFDFGNGLQYGVADPDVPPLLAVKLTPGLQYSATQRAIQNTGELSVGQSLTLASDMLDLSGQLIAGSDLTLQAQDTVQIRDSVDQPFIAAAGDTLLVQGNELVDIFALNHPDSGLFSGANIVLRSDNSVIGDAHYFANGNFAVETLDGNLGELNSPQDPVIRANGDVTLAAYAGNSLHILAGGSVRIPGFIWIQGADPGNGEVDSNIQLTFENSIQLADGTVVSFQGIDGKRQPTLDIRAGIDWENLPIPDDVDGIGSPNNPTPILTDATGADIEVGTIFFADATSDVINGPATPISGLVFLTNRYQNEDPGDIRLIPSQTAGLLQGKAIINGDFLNGGDIEVRSTGEIIVEGGVNADPPAFLGNIPLGVGGDIAFRANGDINILPGAFINSAGALGGNILLESQGNVNINGLGDPLLPDILNGGVASYSVGQRPGENGGTVIINSDSLSISNNAIVATSTTPFITLSGNPGSLLGNPAALKASANPGNITINVNDLVSLTNEAQIRGLIEPGGEGIASRVSVNGQRLIVEDSQILAALFREIQLGSVPFPGGRGQGGEIIVNMPQSVSIRGTTSQGFSSGLLTLTERGALGNGGNITITTGDFSISDGAIVAAATFDSGDGGDIEIVAERFSARNGGQVLTNSGQTFTPTLGLGASGEITLRVNEEIVIDGRDINYYQRLEDVRNRILNPPPNTPANEQVDDIIINQGPFSGLFSNTQGSQSAQDINILSPSARVSLTNGGRIATNTFGIGPGDSGNVNFDVRSLSLLDGGLVLTLTQGSGNAGTINVDASESVNISGGASFERRDTNGNLIFINEDGTLDGGFSSGFYVSTEPPALPQPNVDPSLNSGDGGLIDVTTRELTVENAGTLNARSRSAASAGDIAVNADRVNLRTGGQVVTASYGTGSAGNISLTTVEDVNIDEIDPDFYNRFNFILNIYGGFFLARGFDLATAGLLAQELTQFATGTVLPNSGLQAQTSFFSNGSGDIIVRSSEGNLQLTNGGQISSDTFGSGNGGSIDIEVAENVILSGITELPFQGNNFPLSSSIVSQVANSAGKVLVPGQPLLINNERVEGGDIRISARSLSMNDFSTIAAGTFGFGNAGDITVNAEEAISVDFSTIRTTVETGGEGDGGAISLNARTINMTNGGQALASVFPSQDNPQGRIPGGQGQGGTITVGSIEKPVESISISGRSRNETGASFVDPFNPTQLLLLEGFRSGLRVDTGPEAGGDAGDINVYATTMRISEGGEVAALTQNQNNAGDVTLNIEDTLFLDTGGRIAVDGLPTNNSETTQEILDQFNFDNLGNPGNIFVNASGIELLNGGVIRAETDSGENANINLDIGGLSLRRTDPNPPINDSFENSECSTCNSITAIARARSDATPEQRRAEAGNITIRLSGIFASLDDNSDIVASAEGLNNAGNVRLIANNDLESIVGLELSSMFNLQSGRTPQSDLDATAELGVDGTVAASSTIEFLQEVPELDIRDPASLVDRRCDLLAANRGSEVANEFTVVGRGGLPTTPGENLSEERLIEDLGPVIEGDAAYQETGSPQTAIHADSSPVDIISEPQGWTRTPEGRLVLYAAPASTTASVQLDASCGSLASGGMEG
ncbi:MAG: filamentous hemagglutinin N-terminal domain-containing protein [Cyanobacteria bacterium P01_D01_bin.156]